MSSSPFFGYVEGERILRKIPVKSGETFDCGDFITLDSGYAAKAAAGEKVYAVAYDAIATAPAADGALSITADVSDHSLYRLKADGSVTQSGHQFKTCDFGGYATDGTPQIDVNGSTNDDLYIVGVDADLDVVIVKLKPAPAGVA